MDKFIYLVVARPGMDLDVEVVSPIMQCPKQQHQDALCFAIVASSSTSKEPARVYY